MSLKPFVPPPPVVVPPDAAPEDKMSALFRAMDQQQKAMLEISRFLESLLTLARDKLYTPDLLTEIKSVDGAGSGIDADLLDGEEATAFADASHTHAASDVDSGTFVDARIAESNVTQHEAALDHDALTNFVSQEHIRWDQTGAEDLHDDRVKASNVTQHEGSITHDNLSGVAANEHQTIIVDTFANRPSAGTSGRFFYDTTNNRWYYDDGVDWVNVEPPATLNIVNSLAHSSGADLGFYGTTPISQKAAITAGETTHSLSGTYTPAEIEGALNNLGTRINDIREVLAASTGYGLTA